VENSGAGYQKLLVARGNKRYRKICGRVQLMSKDEKQNRETSG